MLADGAPLIDVRAPAEFARGAIPQARNLPILDDTERARVGTAYRREGQAAAIELGHRLVAGAKRAARIDGWRAFAASNPGTWLYCWRGGLRSETAHAWLREAGTEVPRVPGGYKRLRAICLDTLAKTASDPRPWRLLGGRTGTGKTELLTSRATAIDLENLARHRGSAFGAMPGEQPSPIAFENALAIAFMRHRPASVLLEDEGRTIGRAAIPEPCFARMQSAPVVILEAGRDERSARIEAEYVTAPLAQGTPAAELEASLASALARIQRRLGGLRYRRIREALAAGFRDGTHREWIALLLGEYYDPMYDYQLDRKRGRVVFSGPREAVTAWLDEVEEG